MKKIYNNFFHINCIVFVKILTTLLHKNSKFSETAPKRQFLWAVGQKNFTAHQNLREPKMRFWAVGPPIWPPCEEALNKSGDDYFTSSPRNKPYNAAVICPTIAQPPKNHRSVHCSKITVLFANVIHPPTYALKGSFDPSQTETDD